MSVFDYRLNRKEQLLRKGEPVDNSVDFSGKTSPDFRNKFIAKMKDTNKMYQRESPGQFDDQRAEVIRNNLTAQADDLGQYNDPTDQIKSDAFLAKFRKSMLVNEEEKPSRQGVLQYMQGDPKGPPVNGQFPTDGVKVS